MSGPERRHVLKGAGVVFASLSGLGRKVAAQNNDEDSESENDTWKVGSNPDFEFEGAGQRVTDEIELEDGPVIGELEYSGDASITVTAVPQSDEGFEEPIVSTDQGARGLGGILAVEGPYLFEIEPLVIDPDLDKSDIEWQLAITQPEIDEEDMAEPPLEAEGDESTLLGPIEFDGTETVTATHDGEGEFTINILPEESEFVDPLFFELGEVDSETTVSAEGVAWVPVQATGEWTLTIE